MASVKKFTEAQVYNQLRHIERTIKNPSNKDIDPSLIDYNYSLAPDRGMSSYDYFKLRKNELYCYGRDDVKVLFGWVITAPKELPIEQYESFFRCVYDFLIATYGEENCIQAVIHADEAGQTPHMHFCAIPVVEDKKHGGEKICANDVLNRKELRNFHPDLQKYLYAKGIDARVYTGVTKRQGGNKTVYEFKQERDRQYERTREGWRR